MDYCTSIAYYLHKVRVCGNGHGRQMGEGDMKKEEDYLRDGIYNRNMFINREIRSFLRSWYR